jgi:xanthine dehydrogenase accessory factor
VTRDTLSALLAAISAKRPVVLATDLATGEARVLEPFEPDARMGADVAHAAREAAIRDESVMLDRPGGPVFLRAYNPRVRVVIVGAVHLAQSLVRMIQLAGFEPIVVDPRRAFATAARFEGVTVHVEWPDEALARLGLDRRTALVTMTHDPKIDDPALAAALRSEAFYVGSLGSKKTQAARRDRLRAMGFSDAELARIHGPVGLPIGARSPAEIAIAIASQLVQALRQPAGAGAKTAAP